jgi:hypothetical protein
VLARTTVLALMLVGCVSSPPATVRSVWLPAYGFGAFGGGDLDVRDVCGEWSAVEELSVGTSWATLGVSIATLGVYTPREARLKCKKPQLQR